MLTCCAQPWSYDPSFRVLVLQWQAGGFGSLEPRHRGGFAVKTKDMSPIAAGIPMPHGRLILTVLGGLPEFERELIRARTGEGRKRAHARGVKFGRPPKLHPRQRREAIQRLRNGETQAEIARTYGVDATTIGRLDCAPVG
jgi:hypothetical protein